MGYQQEHLEILFNRVFMEDLLRETILEYVVLAVNSEPKDLKTCRLINKTWLHSVSHIHRRAGMPVFKLYLKRSNSLKESAEVQENGKLLDRFVSTVTSETRLEARIPPFKICASEDFFQEENYNSFGQCLYQCGSSCVILKVSIPGDGGSMPFFFPNISLPRLRKFTVVLKDYLLSAGEAAASNNYHSFYLMETILRAGDNLTEFSMPFTINEYMAPYSFELLTLPPSLTRISFSCQLTSKDLEVLVRNPLPALQHLSMFIPHEPLAEGLIYRILENCCSSLKSLMLEGIAHDGVPKDPTLLRLPRMKKLETLTFITMHCELEDNFARTGLNRSLPQLNSLILTHQTIPMLCKWTDNSRLESVTQFATSLVDGNYDSDDSSYMITFDLLMMHKLHRAFPNLNKLDIKLLGTDTSGLRHLFREMKQLKVLLLDFGMGLDEIKSSDHWDALLLGIEVETAAALRTDTEFKENFEKEGSVYPSIRSLTELQELSLMDYSPQPPGFSNNVDHATLISNAVFHFGFLTMPNLKILNLSGRFKPSTEAKEEWMGEGRVIKYFEVEIIDNYEIENHEENQEDGIEEEGHHHEEDRQEEYHDEQQQENVGAEQQDLQPVDHERAI